MEQMKSHEREKLMSKVIDYSRKIFIRECLVIRENSQRDFSKRLIKFQILSFEIKQIAVPLWTSFE